MIFTKLMKPKSHEKPASGSLAPEIQPNKVKQKLKAASLSHDSVRVRNPRPSEDVAHSQMTLRKLGKAHGDVWSTRLSELVAGPRKAEAKLQIRTPMNVETSISLFPLAGTKSREFDCILATDSSKSKENQNGIVEGMADKNKDLSVRRNSTRLESSYSQVERKVQTLNELQKIVIHLQSRVVNDQWKAAAEVRHLTKDDPVARVLLAMLGAIPPLISMLNLAQPKIQATALLALLNLAIGNETNKAAIVKARAIPVMVRLLRSPNVAVQEAVVTTFLSLSALDRNKAEIGASGAVSMLVRVLETGSMQGRIDALRALYNLSIHPGNIRSIVEAGTVPLLLGMVEEESMAEKALATLSNMATTEDGRKAITSHEGVSYGVLIGALRLMEAPKCQERAVFVLMMVAHHSRKERQAMVNEGAISALLELALLGTPLAQKRAARTIESFRRAKAVKPVSAPLQGAVASTESKRDQGRSFAGADEKQVVDQLIQQSLNRNMQRIVRRGNVRLESSRQFPSADRLDAENSSFRSLPF